MKKFSVEVIAAARLILKERGVVEGGALTDELMQEFAWTTDGKPNLHSLLRRKITGVLGASVRHNLLETAPRRGVTRIFLP